MGKRKREGRRSRKEAKPKPPPVKKNSSIDIDATALWRMLIRFILFREGRKSRKGAKPKPPPVKKNSSIDIDATALWRMLICFILFLHSRLLSFHATPGFKEETNAEASRKSSCNACTSNLSRVESGFVEVSPKGVLYIAKENLERSKSRALFSINGDFCLSYALSVSNAIKRVPGILEPIFTILIGRLELQVIFYASFVTEEEIREKLIQARKSRAASVISVRINNMEVIIGDPKFLASNLHWNFHIMKAKLAFGNKDEIILTEIQYRKMLRYYDKLVGALRSWYSRPRFLEYGYNGFTDDRIESPWESILSVMPHQHMPPQYPPHHHMPHQSFRVPVGIYISSQMPSQGGVVHGGGGGYTLSDTGGNVNYSGTQSTGHIITHTTQNNSYHFHCRYI